MGHDEISTFVKRWRDHSSLSTHHVMVQGPQARKRTLTWNRICQHLDTGLLSLQTVRNKFCCFSHPDTGILLWQPELRLWGCRTAPGHEFLEGVGSVVSTEPGIYTAPVLAIYRPNTLRGGKGMFFCSCRKWGNYSHRLMTGKEVLFVDVGGRLVGKDSWFSGLSPPLLLYPYRVKPTSLGGI